MSQNQYSKAVVTASVAFVLLLSGILLVHVIIATLITIGMSLPRDIQPAKRFCFEPKVQEIDMGQDPKCNPFGDCQVCDWDPCSPATLTCLVSGIAKPIDYPEWPNVNGFYTLRAFETCSWKFESACVEAWLHLGIPSGFFINIDPDCEFPKREVVFVDDSGAGCKADYVNQLVGDPHLQYTGGVVHVNLGLPVPALSWVPALGFLPAANWKYENAEAANDLEQVYIGSRKYKTNCRILFDPAQM